VNKQYQALKYHHHFNTVANFQSHKQQNKEMPLISQRNLNQSLLLHANIKVMATVCFKIHRS